MNSIQKEILITRKERGFQLITQEIVNNLPEIEVFNHGILNLFLLHTSASLTINENTDYKVQKDLERYFTNLVPEKEHIYQHDDEGLDDMPAHIKSVLIGNNLNIPIKNGSLVMGTWQGVFLCEHRNHGSCRKILATIIGTKKE